MASQPSKWAGGEPLRLLGCSSVMILFGGSPLFFCRQLSLSLLISSRLPCLSAILSSVCPLLPATAQLTDHLCFCLR